MRALGFSASAGPSLAFVFALVLVLVLALEPPGLLGAAYSAANSRGEQCASGRTLNAATRRLGGWHANSELDGQLAGGLASRVGERHDEAERAPEFPLESGRPTGCQCDCTATATV